MQRAITSLVLLTIASLANAEGATCDPSQPSKVQTEASLPFEDRWFGSNALAVGALPDDGVFTLFETSEWISPRLFWWAPGFRPGLESRLIVHVRSLGSGFYAYANIPVTNARIEGSDAWLMMTGLPELRAGCYEITGEYESQQLTIVVKVVPDEGIRQCE